MARHPVSLTDTLARLRWLLPASIAITGLAYVIGDHLFLAPFETTWEHILIGVLVLGAIGPLFAWRTIAWANVAAHERDTVERELQARNAQCTAMNAIARAVNRSLDLDQVLNLALDQMLDLMRLEAGEFRMVEGNRLVTRVHRGSSPEAIAGACEVHVGECLCGAAAARGELMAVGDLGEGDGVSLPWCRTQHYRAILSIPVQAKGKISGVLHLASTTPRDFTPHDRQMITSVSHQIGIAVEKTRLHAEVHELNRRLQQRVAAQAVELDGAKGEIADKARQLQQLLIETISLQEKERARIAYDMRDRAVQLIVGALYQIQAARQCVVAESEAAPVLQTAQMMLKQLETEIRQAIYDLRPTILDSLGLEPALRDYANRFREMSGFSCIVSSLGPVRRLSTNVEIAVYRIVQEALHNVARHADASRAEVTFDFRGPNLSVTVADNGLGFDTDEALAQNTRHLGLIGMRERASAIQGELRVMSQPGQGTRECLLHVEGCAG